MNPTDIAELMLEKKASDIKIFDVKSITTITDYFIMCSANSDPQSKAICDNIERTLRKKGMKPINIEGKNKFDWVLMDYTYFIVHIFSNDKRGYYNLDRLWADAKITKVTDDKIDEK